MQYPTVAVNGVSVRVDPEGRYYLNDLHAAAVAKGEATESQRPSVFMQSKQIKRFTQTLSEAEKTASVNIIKGGLESGTWGLEIIAIRYAAWLNPKFEIRVYHTFRDAVLKGINTISQLNRLDLMIDAEMKDISHCACKMNRWGIGGRKQLLKLARERMVLEIQPFLPGVE